MMTVIVSLRLPTYRRVDKLHVVPKMQPRQPNGISNYYLAWPEPQSLQPRSMTNQFMLKSFSICCPSKNSTCSFVCRFCIHSTSSVFSICDIVYQYCWCIDFLALSDKCSDNSYFLSIKKMGYINNEVRNIPQYIGYIQ